MPKSAIHKSSLELKAAVGTTAAPSISSAVDELGRIQQEIREITPVLVVPEDIKTRLKILANQETAAIAQLLTLAKPAADKESIVEGGGFTALVGIAENRRTINTTNEKLKKIVDTNAGKGKFMENCEITLGKLEKLLPAPVLATVIDQARTGTQKVSTAAKAVLEKAA